MSPCRSKQKLTNVQRPASDIAPYKVSVHALKIGGRKNTPRQNAFAEAGSEPLNLILQFLKHVYLGPVRHMTISPCRVLARRSPRAIEKTRLGQQNERTVGVAVPFGPPFPTAAISSKRSAQMHRRCPQAIDSFPGNGCVQRVIHFEDAGSVAVLSQPPLVARQIISARQPRLAAAESGHRGADHSSARSRQTLDRR